MAPIAANGMTLEYELSGDPQAPPLLLIMGLGGQLTAWSPEFVAALAARGFYVIRYDNRDVGRSTWLDEFGTPDPMAALAGTATAPYLLTDMAEDAAALLDGLGLASAHVLGISMGGMIAQALTIQHPDRVRTLVSIMSTTGDRGVGQPHPDAVAALMAPPPTDREGAVEGAVKASKVIGSVGYPADEARIRADAGAAYDRGFHPAGTARHLVAILASPDRTPGLKAVTQPTLVIHGDADPLVDPSGGQATADAVPGAELWMIPGMGHDVPVQLHDAIADRVAAHCLGGT
jgi:pimeloyl-ACP methyl ester carboxylesterase